MRRQPRRHKGKVLCSVFMSNATETFIHAARERLAQQTAAHAASWHLGEKADWAADLDAGAIRLQKQNIEG